MENGDSATQACSNDFDLKIFNDRVGQEFAAGSFDFLAGLVLVCPGEFDFEILADVHGGDSLIAHVFQRVLHGFTLGIEDSFFRCDYDFRFHDELTHRMLL